MLRQHARSLDDARQQHNAVAAEVAAVQQEMTQLQITQWQPILAAFDQQLEVWPLTLSLLTFISDLAFCLSAFCFQKAGDIRLRWNVSSDETVIMFCCCLLMLRRKSMPSAIHCINDKQGHAVNKAVIKCNGSGVSTLKKSGRP